MYTFICCPHLINITWNVGENSIVLCDLHHDLDAVTINIFEVSCYTVKLLWNKAVPIKAYFTIFTTASLRQSEETWKLVFSPSTKIPHHRWCFIEGKQHLRYLYKHFVYTLITIHETLRFAQCTIKEFCKAIKHFKHILDKLFAGCSAILFLLWFVKFLTVNSLS